MMLSSAQQQTFWRLWAQACRANRWTKEDGFTPADIDEGRRSFLRKCGFASLTLVDRTDGFTKVKNELLVLIGESVQAGLETGNPALNKGRNYRAVIERELLPCLGLYVAEPAAFMFMRAVMEDKNRWWKIDRPLRGMGLEDLNAAQLKQLLMTLNARLHAKRRAARHTIHDMRVLAGVKGECAECCRGRVVLAVPAVAEAEEVPVENQPF